MQHDLHLDELPLAVRAYSAHAHAAEQLALAGASASTSRALLYCYSYKSADRQAAGLDVAQPQHHGTHSVSQTLYGQRHTPDDDDDDAVQRRERVHAAFHRIMRVNFATALLVVCVAYDAPVRRVSCESVVIYYMPMRVIERYTWSHTAHVCRSDGCFSLACYNCTDWRTAADTCACEEVVRVRACTQYSICWANKFADR